MKSTIFITSILTILLMVSVSEASTFCDGSALVENLTVNNETIEISNGGCNLGCTEESLSNFGDPGCIENDFQLAIVFLIFAVGGAVSIWLVQR